MHTYIHAHTHTHTHTGPWLTFEIQLPQDDFHLLAWQLGAGLGVELDAGQLPSARSNYHLRGLPSEEALLESES